MGFFAISQMAEVFSLADFVQADVTITDFKVVGRCLWHP